jgi:hypothetical protein
MIGHGWVGPVTGIWCATRRSVMGGSHVGLVGLAVAVGISRWLPIWRRQSGDFWVDVVGS